MHQKNKIEGQIHTSKKDASLIGIRY